MIGLISNSVNIVGTEFMELEIYNVRVGLLQIFLDSRLSTTPIENFQVPHGNSLDVSTL